MILVVRYFMFGNLLFWYRGQLYPERRNHPRYRSSRMILNSDSVFFSSWALRLTPIVESESYEIALKCRLFLR